MAQNTNVGRADYDLVILGGGSAGFAAAIRASELQKTVAFVHEGPIGGTCVNVGCVPSKHLLAVGGAFRGATTTGFQSLHCEGEQFELSAAVKQKDDVVRDLRKSKYEDVLAELDGVTHIVGRGSFSSAKEVKVNGTTVRGGSRTSGASISKWR